MFNRFQDNLNTLVYAFTKFPPNSNIYAEILNIRQSLSNTLKDDKALIRLFEDILEKTKIK